MRRLVMLVSLLVLAVSATPALARSHDRESDPLHGFQLDSQLSGLFINTNEPYRLMGVSLDARFIRGSGFALCDLSYQVGSKAGSKRGYRTVKHVHGYVDLDGASVNTPKDCSVMMGIRRSGFNKVLREDRQVRLKATVSAVSLNRGFTTFDFSRTFWSPN